MTAIIEAIDAWFETNYGSLYTHTFFGFCELAKKTAKDGAEQPMPVTITGTHKRVQVSLDDKKQLITYFRFPGTISQGNLIEENDWSFGLEDANVQTAEILMIVAYKVELGENLIYQIVKKMPGIFSAAGYTIISIERSGISVDNDHEAIYLREFGGGNYERHRFPWNLYSVSIPVSYILCERTDECCNDSIMSESDGDCLIQE